MRGRIPNLIGKTFGEYQVIELAPKPWQGRNAQWICRCSCGEVRRVTSINLQSGNSKSCGHATRPGYAMHGHSEPPSPEYQSWRHMKDRCLNPNVREYRWYGARGITVCERWLHSFVAFLEDMGPRPNGMSLDRIDNDGNYEPGNCRWTTQVEQVRNSRRVVK